MNESLPPALEPLYKLIHSTILDKSEYDITNLASKVSIAVGFFYSIKFVCTALQPSFIKFCTSSITIPQKRQDIYKHLTAFLGTQKAGYGQGHLQVSGDAYDDGERIEDIKTEPALQSGWFWFGGRPLFFQFVTGIRPTIPKEFSEFADVPELKPDRGISIYCLGWSTEIVNKFLQDVKKKGNDKDEARVKNGVSHTRVVTLFPEKCHVTKPTRLLSTIDMEKDIKDKLIKDILKFNKPETALHYANIGRPYRRGYIFWGCPGTGKTSLAFALGGLLQRTVTVASMNEVKDERRLKYMFANVARKGLLLLEDIDSSGIGRENMVEEKENDKREKKSGVSLSALLNAIDGVGASEDGRIIIMTSNNPESLDPALVRPGRMDIQIHLGEVSKEVAESIFLRFYRTYTALGFSEDEPETIEQAKVFAAKIPDKKLTPAEVQTFIMSHTEPSEALEHVDDWLKAIMEAKAAGKSMMGGGTLA